MTDGFAPRPSGLYVPTEAVRDRQKWTRDEWKLLDRATRVMGRHGLTVMLECQEPGCKGTPIERFRRPDGGITLRCAHLDREWTRI